MSGVRGSRQSGSKRIEVIDHYSSMKVLIEYVQYRFVLVTMPQAALSFLHIIELHLSRKRVVDKLP